MSDDNRVSGPGKFAGECSKNFSVAAEKQQGGSLRPCLVPELARFSRELPRCRMLVTAHLCRYGRGPGVGRGLVVGPGRTVGVGLGEEVGVGVAVPAAVAVGVAVAVAVDVGVADAAAVAVAVAVAVALAVAVGVGVGDPPPLTAAKISTRPQP